MINGENQRICHDFHLVRCNALNGGVYATVKIRVRVLD